MTTASDFLFHYSPATGELLGATELQRFDDGTPQLSSYSTYRAPPPFGPGQMAVFRAPDGTPPLLESVGSWQLVADHRGVPLWMPDGTEIKITELGVLPPAGSLGTKPEVPRTQSERERLAGEAVKRTLNELAYSWSYDSYVSARSYKDDPNPKFDAEARALIQYGSACYTLLDAIAAGEVEEPVDIAGLLAMLPSAPDRPVA